MKNKCYAKLSIIKPLNKHICKLCGNTFATKQALGKHRVLHSKETREKPFECSTCEKTFYLASHLKKHQMIHTGEKPYEWDQCGKTLIHSHQIIKHKKTHAERVKDSMCLQCGKTFSGASNLKTHERIHSDIKPFQCIDCGKPFYQLGNLTAHQRSHRGEKLFKCHNCDKAFTRKSKLMKHKGICHEHDVPVESVPHVDLSEEPVSRTEHPEYITKSSPSKNQLQTHIFELTDPLAVREDNRAFLSD